MSEVITVKSETQQISRDLRELYDDYKNKRISRESAETLANIAGKNLRAQAILMVESQQIKGVKTVESTDD